MLVDLRSQWSAPQAPSDTSFGRRLVAASVVASWVVVASTPLFAPVSVQQNVGLTAYRNDKPQAVVYQWPQPDWPSQRSTINANLPAAPKDVFNWPSTEHTVGIWPQPDWPTQRAPFNSQFPTAPPTPSYTPELMQAVQEAWIPPAPSPLWVQASAQEGPTPPPQLNLLALDNAINAWAPLDWPTQTTRKVPLNVLTPPIPNAPNADIYATWVIPPAHPLYSPLLAQEGPPVLPPSPPPPYRNLAPIHATWATKTTVVLWNTYAYKDGPTVIPPSPPPGVPDETFYGVLSAWNPPDLDVVWGSSSLDIIFQPPNVPRQNLDRVLTTWIPADPDRVLQRFTPIPAAPPQNPPFDDRHTNVAVIMQTWDAYTALLTPPAHVIVRVQAAPIIFRRTLSSLGTRIRSRQTHGWS